MGATVLRRAAPGKVNLCLYLGPVRADGLHELVSVVQPVTLCDDVSLEPAGAGAVGDEVVCAGVEGPNLAASALAAFRAAAGWEAPPQRVTITKRVPVAAGMGGGSSDAAATLRLAVEASGRDPGLADLAFGLGADVPALLGAGACLVGGAGEHVEPLGLELRGSIVVLPSAERLATPAVFAEADRLGLARPAAELADLRDSVASGARSGASFPLELMANDLQAAAISLCPSIEDGLERLDALGAGRALVSGSGPTVFGLFPGPVDAAGLPPGAILVETHRAEAAP